MSPQFPFSAIVGQDELKSALLLNAVDPSIGGVLIRGERGTAKSTAARGLRQLLPVLDDGREPPFVELPLGATEDRVVGSLNIERALGEGRQELRTGLLGLSHRGVLYVDEVNLLADHLVDLLLDSAASGQVTIERDGLSATQPARFLLVGSMNPEEGDLRPQFLDRFGLCVEVRAPSDASLRSETVVRRLAFEESPDQFLLQFAEEQASLRMKIAAARARLSAVEISRELLLQASTLCAKLGINGIRGDLTLIKAARALAAWESSSVITPEHLKQAARLALPHRRRRSPFEKINHEETALDQHLPPPPAQAQSASPSGENAAELPPGALAEPGEQAPSQQGSDLERQAPSANPAGTISLEAKLPRARHEGRRKAEKGHGGPVVRHDTWQGEGSLALGPSMNAAAQRGGEKPDERHGLQRSDLKTPVREGRRASRVLFLVDASGSMAAEKRLSLAKGAAKGFLSGNYQRRDEVALMVFRDEAASLLLPFTKTVEHVDSRLEAVPTGGRTPLALALHEASKLAQTEGPLVLVLFTDGRANVALGEGDAWHQALAQATLLSTHLEGAVVVDCETSLVRLERAELLARRLNAQRVALNEIDASGLTVKLRHSMATTSDPISEN